MICKIIGHTWYHNWSGTSTCQACGKVENVFGAKQEEEMMETQRKIIIRGTILLIYVGLCAILISIFG